MIYRNPIISGFNPDPSICRVGQDYYLVTSSCEFFPGLPIYHSTDLVNWTHIGNCIDRPDQLPFDGLRSEEGVWAPTIRYHQGRFYITATFVGFGNFIISATDPAGAWSDPVAVEMGGIDPSLLFDDDKVYYCTNVCGADDREAISLARIDPATGKLLSEIRQIWHGALQERPQFLEAPHIYHIGGWYFLLVAEGGTRAAHRINAARSRSIWGPYEACPNNPLLTNRNALETGVAGSGHGDLVEDPYGGWWCVHLATRPQEKWYSHLGRETFLLPVTWRDEWPVIVDGVSRIVCEGPLWAAQKTFPAWTADLRRVEPQWLFLRSPVKECYACTEEGMVLSPSGARLSDQTGSPTMMAVRQGNIDCTVEADMVFRHQQEGDEAGLAIYISCKAHYTFSKVLEDGQAWIEVAKNGRSLQRVLLPERSSRLTFRITASAKTYALAYVADGVLHPVAEVPVLTEAEAGRGFSGTVIGAYTQCKERTAMTVKLLRFVMTHGK